VVTRLVRLVGALVGAIVLSAMLVAPSWATELEPEPEAPTDEAPVDNGTQVGQVGHCSLVSSPSYIGAACGTKVDGIVFVAQILGKDPVPDCWHREMSAGELAAMGLANEPGPEGYTWYWRWCVTGISKDPNRFDPKYTVRPEKLDHGVKPKTLTKRQKDLISLDDGEGTVPVPIAGISPADHPRVGAWVSFFDGNYEPVVVNVWGMQIRAEVESMTVEPLGKGRGDSFTCRGSGYKAKAGDTPANTSSDCWYKYLRSSAGQPDEEYQVNLITHWNVRYSTDWGATWQHFDSFDKEQVTPVPVTEVQSLVVR
jgi:hypothetical protein